MVYLMIKCLHVLSVMAWIAGLILQCILILAAQQKVETSPLLIVVRLWEKCLSIPGVCLVWITGLYLAMSGAWYQSHWFMVKATIVFLLSGVHGIFAAKIRRYYSEGMVPVLFMPAFMVGLFSMIAFVLFLVIIKPF